MATIVTPSSSDKPHDHLEIHALVDGGYVIREGRFDGQMSDRNNEAQWNWRQERAAFSTLEDAVKWMTAHMVDKSPEVK
jgi:hypothetical protein